MPKNTDIQPVSVALYFLPITLRLPLKFGNETLTAVTCARVKLRVKNSRGEEFDGWGETPLSVQWVWPSSVPYQERENALQDFCVELASAWAGFGSRGHALEIGHEFLENALPKLLAKLNRRRGAWEKMPWLAALVCCSAFDIALHDAYGKAQGLPVYETYNARFMNRDLAHFFGSGPKGSSVNFKNRHPEDFFVTPSPGVLPAWHLVGGKDALTRKELDGSEPEDGYPVVLGDWIRRDGLKCLKIKLRGNDAEWDYQRVAAVGRIGIAGGAHWLSTDFNCTVTEPEYVNRILDRLLANEPRIYGMILYVEQPFPYDLEEHRIDVRSVSSRKPLFMDESAHDWRLVRLGRELGWTGVALKTCKTQTGALLSLCWAKAHGMTLMVQDLTNPMLAQIPHVQLAAHAGTIMGVETNSMQFYPEASAPESRVHPGIYRRRRGTVNLQSLNGAGFGYAVERIKRTLPAPARVFP